MGYQALLFCLDEKLTRVVSQLFSDLEFAVTSVSDPFAAVKGLMAQHYDAVVIDCENEQSASLLVKSARNSSFNQGSLAIALVEGQAGIAKAYRMGANLVLPKPINVEQAKGTLRVARGLLRKGSEPATHPAPATHPVLAAQAPAVQAKPAPAVTPAAPAPQYEEVTPSAQSTVRPEPRTVAAPPAVPAPAFAKSEEISTHASAASTRNWATLSGQAPFVQPQSAPAPVVAHEEPAKPPIPEAPKVQPSHAAAMPFVNVAAKSQGAALAPAPAKEVVKPVPAPAHDEEVFPEDEPFRPPQPSIAAASAPSQAPLFSAGSEQTGSSGGSQKILIGAVAVLLIIAGYFGWTKYGPSHSTAVTTPSPVASAPQPATTPAPTSPASEVPPVAANHAAVATTAPNHAASPAQSTHLAADSSVSAQPAQHETETAKAAPAPIMVRPSATGKLRQTQPSQSEDSSAPLPSALGVSTPNEASLNGLLPTTAAKPSLSSVKVSQGVLQGMLIKQVQPKYPVNAMATHTQGAVQIAATIDKEGHVLNPKVVSGSPLLAPAALEAVRQWRYKPYYLDGQPVEIQTQITIVFKAQ